MHRWLDEEIIAHGRLPLLAFFLGVIVGFLGIRLSVRLIRAKVRWWPGNVKPAGHHVHHMVFGMVAMIVSGIGIIAVYEDGSQTTGAWLAALFGLGAALVLDEFALIFHLRDVYWEEEGRTSVDAVFVAVAVTGMLLLGARPFAVVGVTDFREDSAVGWRLFVVAFAVLNLLLALVVLLKGKIWTGLVGLFFFPLLVIGAVRLSRPGAPWARWRYTSRPNKMGRAMSRERRLRRPVIRAKIYVQDLIAGKPDILHAKVEAEEELALLIHPAPPPPPDSRFNPKFREAARRKRRERRVVAVKRVPYKRTLARFRDH